MGVAAWEIYLRCFFNTEAPKHRGAGSFKRECEFLSGSEGTASAWKNASLSFQHKDLRRDRGTQRTECVILRNEESASAVGKRTSLFSTQRRRSTEWQGVLSVSVNS